MKRTIMKRVKTTGKIVLITLVFVLIGIVDYAAFFDRVAFNAVGSEFHPLLWSALWFDPKCCLLRSLCSAYPCLSAASGKAQGANPAEWKYLLETVAMVNFGLVAAFLKGVSRRKPSRRKRSAARRRHPKEPQPFLLCLEDLKNATRAAHALLRDSELRPGAAVTVMGVLRDPREEDFDSFEAFYRAVQEEDATIRDGIAEAMDVLTRGGVSEDRLGSRVFRTQTSDSLREILNLPQFENYGTILLGSRRLKTPAPSWEADPVRTSDLGVPSLSPGLPG